MVIKDHGFRNPPPDCVTDYGAIRFADGVLYFDALAMATKEATDRQICLNQVASWVAAEEEARGLTEDVE